MPIFIIIFLFFTMANLGLPGTSSFVGEFLLLVSAFEANTTACFFAATSMILGGVYSLWLFNRIAYGSSNGEEVVCFVSVEWRACGGGLLACLRKRLKASLSP